MAILADSLGVDNRVIWLLHLNIAVGDYILLMRTPALEKNRDQDRATYSHKGPQNTVMFIRRPICQSILSATTWLSRLSPGEVLAFLNLANAG
jgi:hypothetical protein